MTKEAMQVIRYCLKAYQAGQRGTDAQKAIADKWMAQNGARIIGELLDEVKEGEP